MNVERGGARSTHSLQPFSLEISIPGILPHPGLHAPPREPICDEGYDEHLADTALSNSWERGGFKCTGDTVVEICWNGVVRNALGTAWIEIREDGGTPKSTRVQPRSGGMGKPGMKFLCRAQLTDFLQADDLVRLNFRVFC
jgi:hypothetical protein